VITALCHPALQDIGNEGRDGLVPRYIGLDLHARYIHGCEWMPEAADGHKERHFRFPNTPDGWAQLLPQLDRTCWVALEVTGSAFEVHDMLSPHADRVLLANPVDLKRLGSGRHTDRVDAARLAKMLAVGTLPIVWVPPQPMRDVRRLLYYRARLASGRRRAINQAKVVLRRNGHLLPRETDVRRWLTQDILNTLAASDRVILLSACRQLTALEAEIDGIEGEIARCVVDVPAVQVLLTITSVGLITAAATWAILGDPHRFSRAKQVTRYAGLDPSIVQSGEQHRQGHISKAGSPLLRTLLVEAANSLARWDSGPLGQFYTRKAQEVGPRKAIIALARKLLIVAWRMLLTGEVYRAARATVVARKQREVLKKTRIQMPTTVQEPTRAIQRPRARVGETEGAMSRQRTLVPS
jgi:transposase